MQNLFRPFCIFVLIPGLPPFEWNRVKQVHIIRTGLATSSGHVQLTQSYLGPWEKPSKDTGFPLDDMYLIYTENIIIVNKLLKYIYVYFEIKFFFFFFKK